MRLTRDFLVNLRIMAHTLVEHMANNFPNPWDIMETSVDSAGDENATAGEITTLADEIEYLLLHSLKLSRQLTRAHSLLATGKLGLAYLGVTEKVHLYLSNYFN